MKKTTKLLRSYKYAGSACENYSKSMCDKLNCGKCEFKRLVIAKK